MQTITLLVVSLTPLAQELFDKEEPQVALAASNKHAHFMNKIFGAPVLGMTELNQMQEGESEWATTKRQYLHDKAEFHGFKLEFKEIDFVLNANELVRKMKTHIEDVHYVMHMDRYSVEPEDEASAREAFENLPSPMRRGMPPELAAILERSGGRVQAFNLGELLQGTSEGRCGDPECDCANSSPQSTEETEAQPQSN
jgi:hypothetical protein